MSSKLTAKLSDGTEWEVIGDGHEQIGPYYNNWVRKFYCVPIKREPREWWCVEDGGAGTTAMFPSKAFAVEYMDQRPKLRGLPFLVREVIE